MSKQARSLAGNLGKMGRLKIDRGVRKFIVGLETRVSRGTNYLLVYTSGSLRVVLFRGLTGSVSLRLAAVTGAPTRDSMGKDNDFLEAPPAAAACGRIYD